MHYEDVPRRMKIMFSGGNALYCSGKSVVIHCPERAEKKKAFGRQVNLVMRKGQCSVIL